MKRGTWWKGLMVVAAIAGLTSCVSEPSQSEREAASDFAWRTTVGTSEQAIARLPVLFPDIEFNRDDVPERHDRWADCSSSSPGDALDPTAITWRSLRQVVVSPPRETATFGRALVDSYVAEGWEVSDEREAGDEGESIAVDLRRDSYVMTVVAVTAPDADLAPLVRVTTYSPCLDAPDKMGERPWQEGPTEPPRAEG